MIQRRAMAGTAVAVSALVLSACGFQSPAVTNHEHTSDQGANFDVGAVKVRNVYVTSLETSANRTSSYIVATFVNTSPTAAQLTGITSSAGTISLAGSGVDALSASGTTTGGSLTIPPNGVPIRIDQPVLTPGGATAQLVARITPTGGSYVPLEFSFGDAGTSPTVQAPVVPPTQTTAVASPVPTDIATPPPAEGQESDGSN